MQRGLVCFSCFRDTVLSFSAVREVITSFSTFENEMLLFENCKLLRNQPSEIHFHNFAMIRICTHL